VAFCNGRSRELWEDDVSSFRFSQLGLAAVFCVVVMFYDVCAMAMMSLRVGLIVVDPKGGIAPFDLQ
jgi:hypothetical protein